MKARSREFENPALDNESGVEPDGRDGRGEGSVTAAG
jgi:hypothetical protein